MDRFYVFIIHNDVWIYILCAFGLFWYGSELFRAQRILRQAIFGLERETGSRMRNNAVVFLLILGMLAGFVFFVNASIAPTLPPELLTPPTPTPDIFATPLSSPTPLNTAVPPTPTGVIAPTVTLAGTIPPVDEDATAVPTETAVPEATPTPFVGCRVNLNIIEPGDGSVVSGVISFTGTANTPNFGYYTLEANGPQTNGQWASLLGRAIDQPVNNSFLGNADLGDWASGPYLVRLTAVDQEGNTTGSCVIQVTMSN
ncbi:MAG: hypothetical protein H6662_08785 [Ardenticatenaceae bacterium]|nr:hypothetical protein [Ardenticatenaceae bacterium]MCB9003304.1 hypothetical protein [Ardenticatenaceae bacterium]